MSHFPIKDKTWCSLIECSIIISHIYTFLCQLLHKFIDVHLQRCPTVLFVLALMQLANAYEILFLTPFNAKSHWILMERIIETLLNRQHHVTTITNFKWNGPKPANYTEILIDPPLNFESYSKEWTSLHYLHSFNNSMCSCIYNHFRISRRAVQICCSVSISQCLWISRVLSNISWLCAIYGQCAAVFEAKWLEIRPNY